MARSRGKREESLIKVTRVSTAARREGRKTLEEVVVSQLAPCMNKIEANVV